MNHTATPDAFNTIVRGGLVAGVLDAVDSVIAYGILGQNPVQVLQYVASGLLGNNAYAGFTAAGFANAGLGAALHFFIAFVVATVYYLAARKIAILRRRPIVFGLAYGAAVFLFMAYIVLPNSNVTQSPFSLGMFLNGIIGHALFVGLPIAWYATRPRQLKASNSIRPARQVAAS
jgi:uncharacterized membrane protein YagU involved in acid resistance